MKAELPVLLQRLHGPSPRPNIGVLVKYVLVLVAIVMLYTTIFHFLMMREGKDYSWITGLYWTLTVMSTLGFGDITFSTDLGRIFSIFVLMSGIVFLLILLPFIFIEFFYEPWITAQAKARVPRGVGHAITGHVILTHYGPIGRALVDRLVKYQYPYVVLLPEIDEAIELDNEGVEVVAGDLNDPETYRRLGIDKAALVFTSRSDVINTSVAFTVRGVNPSVPIVATARADASVDILGLAGCTRVLRLAEMTGEALARRTRSGPEVAHVIGRLGAVQIAEANAIETPLVGKTLREERVREQYGVNIVGLWERGGFEIAGPESVVNAGSVLVLAGAPEHFDRFNEICRRDKPMPATAPVVIIGGGRVGRATARALSRRQVQWRIVEEMPERIRDSETYVLGSAADLDVLKKAGIDETPAVVITTRDDDTNVYLTIYCRMLRPDVEIISRSTDELAVPTLHRAGCEFVISYATTGASTVFNQLRRSNLLMIAEGLDVFKVEVPNSLRGKTVAQSALRAETGCNIVAVELESETIISPEPELVLESGASIVLIGTVESQNRFLSRYA